MYIFNYLKHSRHLSYLYFDKISSIKWKLKKTDTTNDYIQKWVNSYEMFSKNSKTVWRYLAPLRLKLKIEMVIFTSWFHEINLTRCWPCPVSIVFGHEPNGWPQPISRWNACLNFNPSVAERKRVHSPNSSTSNWVDNIGRSSSSFAPPKWRICAPGTKK